MQISVDLFKDSVKKASSIIKDKGTLDTDDKLVFDGERLYGNCDGRFVSVPFKGDFKACVNGVDLAAYCAKLSGVDMEITVKENALSIVQGRSSARFELFDSDIDAPDEGEWKGIPQRFIESVLLTSQGCGNDYSDIRTVVIHFAPGFAEANDGQRIVRSNFESGMDGEFLMPNSFVPVLSMFEVTEYCELEDWMLFRDEDGAVFGHRKIAALESYKSLNLDSVLDECSGGQEVKFPEKLYDAVNKAAVFLSKAKFESEKRITIKCKGGRLRVESHGGSGAFCEVMPIESKGNFGFQINPKFLLDMLEKSVVIKIANEYMRIESENYVYLTSLSEG